MQTRTLHLMVNIFIYVNVTSMLISFRLKFIADVTTQATPVRHHARGGDVENMEERDM